MDQKFITPLILGAALTWAVYRGMRRSFGRQAVYAGQLKSRIGIFAAVGAVMLWASGHNPAMLAALMCGAAGGGALGWVGLRHTKFETTPEGNFYTPHTYIGLLVTALFVGRLIFRMVAAYPEAHTATQAGQSHLSGVIGSPLTSAILGLLIGYYVAFYVGVLRRSAGVALPPAAIP